VVGLDALFTGKFGAGELYIHTNLDAPRYRLLRTDLQTPQREHWEEIIPESDDAVLESVTLAGGRIVARYLRNAASTLTIFDGQGAQLGEVALPALGSVTEVTGSWDERDAFFAFESFAVAPVVYRLPPSGEPERFASIESGIDAHDFEVNQVWYPSSDGTPISMFIVHRTGLDLTRSQPTLLTGYGGFNLARVPQFSRTMLFWLERGGVFTIPNLRGGSEYGEEWHRAGTLARKQNVFDDFIAAAEYLIERGFTDRDRLCAFGRSNGGLLVGAALTQRPDLFRTVVCGVPLLDMVRYHLFLIARLWIPEYGSSEDPAQFEYLLAYSPYHHVVQGESYPAVYFFAAESDSRVDPCHARKMTALLQAASGSGNPILLHMESRAGHGIGKPVAKLVEDETDFWSFVCRQISGLPLASGR
jgi:prolyl oligopeptidase